MPHIPRPFAAVLFLTLALAAPAFAAPADDKAAASPAARRLDPAALQAKLDALKARPADDRAAAEAAHDLAAALEALKAAEAAAARISEWESYRASAPALVASLRKELEKPWSPAVPTFDRTPVAELEKARLAAEADLAAARRALEGAEAELKALAERRIELPKILAALRAEPAGGDETAPPPPRGEAGEARALRDAARRLRAEREIAAAEKELACHDLKSEHLKALREEAARRAGHHERVLRAAEAAVAERRKNDAERAAERAREEFARVTRELPALASLAAANAKLAARRVGEDAPAAEAARAGRDLEERERLLARVRDDHRTLRERVRLFGLTHAIGLFLRTKREELPDVGSLRRAIAARAERIAAAQAEVRDFDDEALALGDLDAAARAALEAIDAPAAARAALLADARELLKARRPLLEALARDANARFARLVDLDSVESRLIEETEAFSSFIDEHILWVRNAAPVGLSTLAAAGRSLAWLLAPKRLADLAADAWGALAAAPVWHAALLFSLALVFRLAARARSRLADLAAAAGPADGIRGALEALPLTLARALPAPLALAAASSLLANPAASGTYGRAVADALRETAWLLFTLLAVRRLFEPGGFAEAHLRLGHEDVGRRVFDRCQRLAVRYGVPLHFAVVLTLRLGHERTADALGRILFIVGTLLAAWIARRLGRSSLELARREFDPAGNPVAPRLRLLYNALFVAFPLALAALAGAGWYYSARQLFARWAATLLLLVGAFLLHAFAGRALLSLRRSLARRVAEERCRAAADPAHPVPPPADERTLHDLGNEARLLVTAALALLLVAGLVFTWRDVFPAFRTLERVTLWNTTARVGAEGAAEGAARLADAVVPVSLYDLLLAIAALSATFFASRYLPGFLEFAVLRRTALDQGARFAVRTVTGYVITIVGAVVSFQMIYVGWEKVQWLAAAVSVGLGFGLQEIFANFVSGLILLFERPVRVGDVVTIGADTGSVTRIRIRATTVMNWDRREVVIPNKEFITGRLVNWTLSDTVQRVVFKVGVSYDADPDLTRAALHEVASAHPDVLKEPPAKALFIGFGDSALNFELRVFIPNLDRYADFVHEMNSSIHRALAARGIAIPYPIRDVRLSGPSSPPTRV